MARPYHEISTIARQRRNTALASFHESFSIEKSALPNDLTAFLFNSRCYTTDEVEILQSEAEDILQKIMDRIWTAVEVAEAFMKAAAVAQQLVSVKGLQGVD
jgi:amidase